MTELATVPASAEALAADRLAMLRAIERKLLWLSSWTIHHANHLRPSRDKLKVGGHQASCASVASIMTALYFDVLRPGRPGRGQAAREPDLPRRHAPARPRADRAAAELPGAGRRAVLSVAHQGPVRRRLLDRLGRPGCGDDAVRLADPGLCPPARPGARRRAAGPDGRHRRRRRARRGQHLRGPARGLEARRPQSLVGHRLQPPEPRPGRARSCCSPRSSSSSPPSAGAW